MATSHLVLLLYLVSFALAGCSDDSMEKSIQRDLISRAGAAELEMPGGVEVVIARSDLWTKDSVLGAPHLIRPAGQYVFVADQAKGPRLHVFSRDGIHIKSLGRWGRGPGDFESVLGVDIDSSSAFLFDYNLSRLTEIDLDSIASLGLYVRNVHVLEPRPYSVQVRSDRSLLVTNALDSSLFGVGAAGQRSILPFEVRTSFSVEPGDSAFLKSAYEARICGSNPSRFAAAYKYFSHVSIVDEVAAVETAADVPYQFTPTFIELPIVGRRTFKGGAPGVRIAYLDCVATDRSIFALFSGRLQGKYEQGQEYASRQVHVFDWDGRIEAIIELDHDAYSIALIDGQLLSISASEIPTIRSQVVPTFAEVRK